MKYYKLLTQEMTSHKNTKWEVGVPITIEKEGVEMCTDQVLHCYNHPLLAVISNPIHANVENPKLFEISVDEIVNSDGLKFASKSQTLIKAIPLPEISIEQKIEFAIRVTKLVYKDEKWNLWADSWLNGSDRGTESADAANAVANAAYAAAYDAAYAAVYAADAASYAATNAAANAVAANAVAKAANAVAKAVYAYAVNVINDKNEFNRKMIDIIESIVKINE